MRRVEYAKELAVLVRPQVNCQCSQAMDLQWRCRAEQASDLQGGECERSLG
jgi:hypothetical protein